MTFNHENLKVYQRTLTFNAHVSAWVPDWDKRHAICDHLPRAAESILDNIAMASAAYSAAKLRSLDYSIGSTLECAACLDIAGIKRLIDTPSIAVEKNDLSELLKMLVGLRRSWSGGAVHENREEYVAEEASCTANSHGRESHVLFHHEKLDVYQLALRLVNSVSSAENMCALPPPAFRRLDVLLTSVVLNIAEGNGRFSAADQRRFLSTSHEAAIKMAAKLDLYAIQGALGLEQVSEWKAMLSRLSAMTASMVAGCRE
jgi:four helix bundle protein